MTLRGALAIALKLLLACLVVGLLLSFLGLHPANLLRELPELLRDAVDRIVRLVRWALPYVQLGAIVVVPVAAVYALVRLLRRR